jgi:hypothetical protein
MIVESNSFPSCVKIYGILQALKKQLYLQTLMNTCVLSVVTRQVLE